MAQPELSILEIMQAAGQEPPRVRLPSTNGTRTEGDAVGRAGRYEIIAPLAEGGVGEVLRGRDLDLGRDVALKRLRVKHRTNPELVQRMLDEAQIGGQLQHPSIVPVYEIGMDEEHGPFFAMKLVKGKTLAARLAERSSPTERRRRFLRQFEQLAQAVAYAHARAVVHRDLKPSNVMVGAFGDVQLLDWGFAKVLRRGGLADEHRSIEQAADVTRIATVRTINEGSLAGSVVGTPAYMPPEQALGDIDDLDERCDVFALGAILCELLTGAPPYVGTRQELMTLAAQARLDDAHARLADCGADAALVTLCRSCLEPLRRDRPRDASIVADGVHEYLVAVDERGRQARITAAETRAAAEKAEAEAGRQRRGRRQTLFVGAAVLALLGAGIAGAWGVQRDARAQASRAATAVTAALQDGERLRGEGRFEEALQAAQRADELVAKGDVPTPLRARVSTLTSALQAERRADQARVAQLAKDEAMSRRLRELGGRTPPAWGASGFMDTQVKDYAVAFRTYGLDLAAESAKEMARAIRGSAIQRQLIRGLEAWAADASDQVHPTEPGWEQLLEVLKLAAPDPWAAKVRRAWLEGDQAALNAALLDTETIAVRPERTILLALALLTVGEPGRALGLLESWLVRNPADLRARHVAGNAALRLGELRAAKRHRLACVALDVDGQRNKIWLARVLNADGDFRSAVAWFEGALAAKPDSLEHVKEFVQLHRSAGTLDTATKAWTKQLEERPDDPQLLALVGFALCFQSQAPAGVENLSHLVDLLPESAEAHGLLGLAHTFTFDRNAALEALAEAIKRAPSDIYWIQVLGSLMAQRGTTSLSEATTEFEALLPDTAQKTRGLFLTAYAQRRVVWSREDAVEACREAASALPESFWPHLLEAAFRERGSREARLAAERAVQRAQGHARAHWRLGKTALDTGDIVLALGAFKKAAKLDAANRDWHRSWIGLLALEGRAAEAVAHYQGRMSECPTTTDRIHLGLALLLAQRTAEASCVLEESHRERPNDAELAVWLAICAYRLDRANDALALLEKAARARPLSTASHFLGDLHLRMGAPEKARDVYFARVGTRGQTLGGDQMNLAYAATCCAGPGEAKSWSERNVQPLLWVASANIAMGIGDALCAQGRLPEAIECLKQASAKCPQPYALLQYTLGEAHRLRGDYARAQAAGQAGQAGIVGKSEFDHEASWERGRFRVAVEQSQALSAQSRTPEQTRDFDDQIAMQRVRLLYYDRLATWGTRLEALHGHASAIRQGTYAAKTARDALDAGEFARCDDAHAAAVPYFARAIEGKVEELTQERMRIRFRAARAAVRAAAAEGCPAAERARLHEKARAWLRAELPVWRERLAKRPPRGRWRLNFSEPELWHWKFHVDMASVHEDAALAQLPDAERKAWEAFWLDVEKVLKSPSR